MHATISLLNILLPMLYAVAALAYLLEFVREDPLARKAARPLLGLVVGLHALYLGLRIGLYEHVPLASIFEVMTTVAFAVAVVYLYVDLRTRTHRTGIFLLAFSFLFQTISSAFLSNTGEFPRIFRSPLFAVHTGSAVLGYTAFAVSAIYGVLYLLLYHDLKASRFGLIYQRLPSLDLLATMSLKAAVFGLAFLTLTIAFGIVWGYHERSLFPTFYKDPILVLNGLVWAVYAAGVLLHYGFGWSARRTIALSLVGPALIVVSSLIVGLWLPSFHGGFTTP